ncbi:hypothetical protein O0L34_g8704 [Tuta absoluta]|nr:hypothetical protein O0L34_g8704 [Tuta absoluta]
MCEAQYLIKAVEKYPCLWDIKNKDYHTRDAKDLAWEQVCKEVINDWETCTDKTNKCAELKKKWTNIRDYYRKELQKSIKSPSGSAAKNKYKYGDLLYFLTPILRRKSERNVQDEDSESNQSQLQSQNEEETYVMIGETIKQECTNDINYLEQSEPTTEEEEEEVPTTPPVHKKKKKDIPAQILKILQQRQTTMSSNVTEDDDAMFLLSFRSYMKKMTIDQKIEFKMGMLELVKIMHKKST